MPVESLFPLLSQFLCMCACVRACVCVGACVRACVRACDCVCVLYPFILFFVLLFFFCCLLLFFVLVFLIFDDFPFSGFVMQFLLFFASFGNTCGFSFSYSFGCMHLYLIKPAVYCFVF